MWKEDFIEMSHIKGNWPFATLRIVLRVLYSFNFHFRYEKLGLRKVKSMD